MTIHQRWRHHLASWGKVVVASTLLLVPLEARADEVEMHPLRLHGEGGLGFMLNEPYRSRFENGVDAIARFGVEIAGPLSVQASVANLWLPAQQGERGRMYTLEGGLRASFSKGGGFLGGPVIDINAGVGFTGGLRRLVVDPGVGWELVFADWVSGGPMLRYMQVVQPSSDPQPNDGRLFLAGIGLTFGIPVRATVGTVDQEGDSQDRLASTRRVPEAAEQPETSKAVATSAGSSDEAVTTEPKVAEASPAPIAPEPTRPAPSAISLKERIHFAHGQAVFRGSENATALQDVCRQMKEEPHLVLRIAGHADETGSAGFNQSLSAQRAASVARWMTESCEIPASRVEITAFGDSRPACTEGGPSCNAKNRRVEFELVER